MGPVSRILLSFLLITSCHSPVSVPEEKVSSPRASDRDPFDRQGELVLTKHARCRMDCRHITTKEIHEILNAGTINYEKSQPDAHPDPKYALEGYTVEQQHLRIIIAPEEQKLVLITCIDLGEEWDCHCN